MPEEGERKGTERRTFLQTLGVFGSLAAAGEVTATTPGRTPSGDRNELIVGTTDGASVASAESSAMSTASADIQVTHRNEQLGYFTVEQPGGAETQSVDQLRQELEGRSDVAYVEENATYETQRAPNDSRYDTQYAPQQVNAPQAWDSTLGDEDVTIGVIDQGAAYGHPDLQARFGSDKGKDFVDGDDDPVPDVSSENHGTHVSGCASATTDNNEGVAGVSNSTLLSCRALSENGTGSTTDIADAIQWAADQDIDIINMSLGGGGFQQTMKDAVSYAAEQGVLVVCAAGNGYGASVSYPAAYEECVAVSALDPDENLASFSNKGEKIDVASPGVNVLSTVPGNGYEEFSGTSMACPVASGVAALGLAADPDLSARDLKQRLQDTAVDVGLGAVEQGAGRVDAANIVDAGDGGGGGGGNESPTASASAGTTEPTAGQSVSFDGAGSSDADGSITSYEWTFGDGGTATGAEVTHTYDAAGEYTATLTVTDDDGATATDSVTLSVQSDGGDGGDGGSGPISVVDDQTIEVVVEVEEDALDGYLYYGVNGDPKEYKHMEEVENNRFRTTVSSLSDGDVIDYEFRYYTYEDRWDNWKYRDSTYTFQPDGDDGGDGGSGPIRVVDDASIKAVYEPPAESISTYFGYALNDNRRQWQQMDETGANEFETTLDGLSDGDTINYQFAYYADGWTYTDPTDYTFQPDDGGGGDDEQAPYNGPHTLPGQVQAEDFDTGGEGVAYHDTTDGNSGYGDAYRDTDVDIATRDGTTLIGWIDQGEWWEYTVEVEAGGDYELRTSAATPYSGRSLAVSVDGDQVASAEIGSTGGWWNPETVSLGSVSLSAGEHVIRVEASTGAWNFNWFEVTDSSGAGDSSDGSTIEDGTYKLVNVNSGKALDVSRVSRENGATLHQWGYSGGANQQWQVEDLGGGEYRLTAQHSGKVADVEGVSRSDGADVHQWEWANGDNQKWRIESVGDGEYKVESVHSGKVLEVADSSTTNGGNVQQWSWNGNDNQRWRFEDV